MLTVGASVASVCRCCVRAQDSPKAKELGQRGITLDEWKMLLNFFLEIKPDCSNYSDDGAWPLLLDDYVEWVNEQQGDK